MLRFILVKYFQLVIVLLIKYIFGLSQEMVEQGRVQYQLLQERTNLPNYGSCWKSAIEHIDEGCRSLSEETQSSIALHLANCFLEMSGHESYNCELEKKANLKQICLSSMSDRAFNVYTEFYTHTQNICWFLRGQVWQEMIAENTYNVGKQLQISAKNQEDILKVQRESLQLQERLLQHGHNLEKIMEDFYVSTLQHQEILSVMSSSMNNLQSWLIGEFSWIDMLIFYICTSILIIILTSSNQTLAARFPIWVLLIINIAAERLINLYVLNNYEANVQELHVIVLKYVWLVRKIFYVLAFCILAYTAYHYHDLNRLNNRLLQTIYDQNRTLLKQLLEIKTEDKVETDVLIVQERNSKSPFTQSFTSTPLIHETYSHIPLNHEVKVQRRNRYNLRSTNSTPQP